VLIAAASTGSFRRFERFMMVLVLGSLLLVPIAFAVHPPVGQVVHDFIVPGMPKGGKLSDVMLLIIAIVGTTVAPWQLFFQQSYVIDKRIGPAFIAYEKVDLWLGIVVVVIGGVAMMAFAAAAFHGTAQAGQFTDAAGVARGLEAHAGRMMGVLFAIALIDASIAVAAALVLIPGTPLGLLTNAVQTLAGVLLPSATVFLLLLCNDAAVLGPWRNGRWLNLFTGAVIALLVMLSVILTASVLFPDLGAGFILGVLGGGSAAGLAVAILLALRRGQTISPIDRAGRADWRMAPVDTLPVASLGLRERLWMGVLRLYLVVAGGLVLVRIVHLAIAHR